MDISKAIEQLIQNMEDDLEVFSKSGCENLTCVKSLGRVEGYLRTLLSILAIMSNNESKA